MRVKVCVLEETQGIHLHTKFHVNVFFVLASGSPKPQFWTNFDIVGGSCTDHLLPMRCKFSAACARADPWCTLPAKFRIDQFILSPSGSDKTQIFPFFGLRHFVVSPIAGKNRLRLRGEIGRTNSDVQKRDEQTQKLNVFGRSGDG